MIDKSIVFNMPAKPQMIRPSFQIPRSFVNNYQQVPITSASKFVNIDLSEELVVVHAQKYSIREKVIAYTLAIPTQTPAV